MPGTLTNLSDGTFSLTELREKIRPDDPRHPVTSLVCIKNTHNKCGGVALPEDWISQVSDTATYRFATEFVGILEHFFKMCSEPSICTTYPGLLPYPLNSLLFLPGGFRLPGSGPSLAL